MSYKAVARRLSFYSKWYACLPIDQLQGFTGKWVMERIIIFSGILKDMDTGISNSKVGNYG